MTPHPDSEQPVRGMGTVMRGGATYSLVFVVQGAVQLLLLPVYTRAFTSSEYGQLGVAISIALFANVLLSFGLELAVVRTYFALRPRPDEQRSAVATLGLVTLVLPLGGAVLLSLIAVPALDGALTPSRYLVLALFGSAFYVSATVLPLALLRAEDRLRDYVRVSGTRVVVSVVLTAVFVLLLDWGPAGFLLGALLANALALAVAVRVLPWPRPRNLNRAHAIAAFAIGLPMLPHLISGWALQLSDRAILGGLVSHADVGVYSLAVNLAIPVLMIMTAISQAIHPSYGEAIHSVRARAKLPELVHFQIVVICLTTAAVALLGPVAVSAVIPPSYAEAADLIPWLALGFGLWGAYAIPMNAISLLAGKTTWVWTVTGLTAALRVGTLYWLVPSHGLHAAAIGLPACNLVLVVAISVVAAMTRGAELNYDWGRGARVVAVTLLLAGPVAVLQGHDTALDAALRVLVLALLPVAFLAAGGFSREQRERLLGRLRALVSLVPGVGRAPVSARR
jgi:O-antigen/teichoic acid export membrane protein